MNECNLDEFIKHLPETHKVRMELDQLRYKLDKLLIEKKEIRHFFHNAVLGNMQHGSELCDIVKEGILKIRNTIIEKCVEIIKESGAVNQHCITGLICQLKTLKDKE